MFFLLSYDQVLYVFSNNDYTSESFHMNSRFLRSNTCISCHSQDTRTLALPKIYTYIWKNVWFWILAFSFPSPLLGKLDCKLGNNPAHRNRKSGSHRLPYGLFLDNTVCFCIELYWFAFHVILKIRWAGQGSIPARTRFFQRWTLPSIWLVVRRRQLATVSIPPPAHYSLANQHSKYTPCPQEVKYFLGIWWNLAG